jgi:H+/gluconate symporter-like permease
MEMLSLFGIILGLAVFIWFAYKGVHILVLSIIASIIIAIFSGMNPVTTITDTYMTRFAAFAKVWFLVYLFSAIFARMMSESGAARSIAVKIARICKRWPKKQKFLAILSIPLINSVLTYGGVSSLVVVFIMVGLAKDLFMELDIPWHFYGVAALGSATFALGLMPGAPDVINLVPTTYLGTTPLAGAGLGILGTILMIGMACFYVNLTLNKTELAKEGFLPTGSLIAADDSIKTIDMPEHSLLKSITPPIVLLVVLNALKQPPVVALLSAIVACIILFPRLNIKNCIAAGTPTGVVTNTLISGTVAFGAVVTATPAYAMIVGGFDAINFMSPAFQLFTTVNIVAAVTSSGTSAVTIAMDQFAQRFLEMGVPAAGIHRLTSATALALNTLPHSAGVVNAAGASRLTHAQIYRHYFWITVVFPFIVAFLMAILISFNIVF